jgi:murein DD-endopeptidase MepM/ murein hydrolase activator NlpD
VTLSWVRPFFLGSFGEVPITQEFANNNPGVEPLGYYQAGVGVYPSPHAGAQAGNWHRGVDYGLPKGYRVRAPAAGVVIEATFDLGWGANVIRFQQGRYVHTFGHVSEFDWIEGRKAAEDAILGLSGGVPGDPGAGNSSGAHLHWEVWDQGLGVYVAPVSHLVRRAFERF